MDPYEKIKLDLLERKRESEERLRENAGFGLDIPLASSQSSGELSQYDNHPADSGTAVFEREKDFALRKQVEDELRDVNHALEKMENGTYGICEVTGQPIPLERLQAIPTARTILESTPSMVSDYRPVEEDVLSRLEKEYYTGSDETEFNEQNAYQQVASFNESDMTYEGSSLIDNMDGMGYVTPIEAIASTGIAGYEGDDNVQYVRNIQYDKWMNQENLNEPDEELEDPGSVDKEF
ncbi:MAG TPA: TraR/DksA C4-type zinc finger protein [Bacillales bacterium]|nr:TraR/DksA C4-type zinc finger protein [Bacillales bacterium]